MASRTSHRQAGSFHSASFRGLLTLLLPASALLLIPLAPLSPADAQGTSTAESSPWSQTNANAAQSRVNLTEKLLTPSAVTSIRFLRDVVAPKRPVNRYCGRQGIVAPVLAGGYLYATTNYVLSKYNAATGKLIWRVNPDRSLTTYYQSLAVAQNLVIVGGLDCISVSEPSGLVEAFNASTGALVWSSADAAEGLGGAVVSGSYVVTAGETAAGYEVSVVKLSTGKGVWASGDCGNGSPSYLPLVVGGLVMSYGCDKKGNEITEARKLATGAVVWKLPGAPELQRGDLDTSAGTHLYVTDPSGTVEDLNPQTGQVAYSLSQAVNVLAVGKYRVYATCGSQGQYICAYDISTGALEWQDTSFSPAALAAEAAGVLYLDSGVALNAGTGQYITMWRTSSAQPPANAIAVGDGRVAAVSGPRVLNIYGLPGY